MFLPAVAGLPGNVHAKLPPPSIEFEHFTAADGLTNPVVYDIAQDSRGYLWFATGSGLNRYDGYEFKNYLSDPTVPNAIGKGLLLKLFVDSKKRLWIASFSNGLFRYDDEQDHFIRYHPESEKGHRLPGNNTYCITEDQSGKLWISFFGNGVVQYDTQTDQYVHYRHEPDNPNSLSSDSILAILCDSQGKIWMSSQKDGLDILDPATGVITHHLKDTPHAVSMIEDQFNDIWIPTMGQGVIRYIREENRFVSYTHDSKDPSSINHNLVLKVAEDRHGIIWLTTWGGGVNVYDRENDRFISYSHHPSDPGSLNSNNTWGIFEDKTGVIWVGTYGSGVNKYDRKKERFNRLRSLPDNPNSLSHNSVKAIHEDDEGILWFGTLGGGLCRYDRKNNFFQQFRHNPGDPDSIAHNNIWKIAQDPQNRLWIATENGLDRYDPEENRFVHFKNDPENSDSIASNQIRTVFVDDNGVVWAGNQLVGFDRYNEKENRFVHYKIKGAYNSVLYQDSKGRMWAGNQNLFLYDPDKDQFLEQTFPKVNNQRVLQGLITTMIETPDHQFWIGTTSGLLRFDPENQTITPFDTKDGLNDNAIADLLLDWDGRLWTSTGKGISLIDDFENKVRNYELGPFNRGAGVRSENGTLFFGGINGVTHFAPFNLSNNPFAPNIVITSFKKLNKESHAGGSLAGFKNIELTYEDRFFSFEFAALDFSEPQKNQYRYRLIGFDDNWIHVNHKRRFASYTNLGAGEYVFQVQGSNNDGIWNIKGASVKINITPPWWKSLSFYMALTLAGMFLIAITFWYVTRLRFEINERRAAEHSLSISEEKYRHLVEETRDLITTVGSEGNLLFINTPARKILGMARDMSAFDFVHPDDKERTQAWFDEKINAGVSDGMIENRMINPQTNETHTMMWTCRFHYRKESQIDFINSIARDITDRKRYERALQNSEERYRHLFDHAPTGMFEMDLKQRRLTEVNTVFSDYTGYTQKELLSMNPLELLPPKSRDLVEMAYRQYKIDNHLPKELECDITTKTNETLYLVLNIDYVYNGRNLTNACVVAHNITERKKMENMIIQSEKMMSVGGLAAGMAHEINNPLAGMMQNAQVVQNRLTGDLAVNEQAAKELGISMSSIRGYMDKRNIVRLLDDIRKAGARAARIIENMLSFSKKGSPEKIRACLDEIITNTIELAENDYDLKKKYDFREIEVLQEFEPDVPEVMCEPSKIQQVLFNIVRNASEAMNQQISPKEKPRLIVRLTSLADWAQIEIEDNGPGIDDETRKRIFEPFFTTKSVDKGTGLGLSVSYFIIVEDHNGEMDVKSEIGKGTTFLIRLPL